MNTVTYCDNGHLWDKETGKPCYWCAAEENSRELKLIDEIEKALPEQKTGVARGKLQLLKDILTD